MKILVACERSGIVRDAFRERGHDAVSCDLAPSESPGPHIIGDVRPLLRESWDMVIACPPCTYLTVARAPLRDLPETAAAVHFFLKCLWANSPLVCVENPLQFRAVRKYVGEPAQKIHPYQFGDLYLKRTCLWLKGLPPLLATHYQGTDVMLPSLVGGTNSRRAGRPALYRTSAERSRFHPGVAKAMAQQWG